MFLMLQSRSCRLVRWGVMAPPIPLISLHILHIAPTCQTWVAAHRCRLACCFLIRRRFRRSSLNIALCCCRKSLAGVTQCLPISLPMVLPLPRLWLRFAQNIHLSWLYSMLFVCFGDSYIKIRKHPIIKYVQAPFPSFPINYDP